MNETVRTEGMSAREAASAARPKSFPQVQADEHSSGVPCETCHQPHSPAIDASAAAVQDKAAPRNASPAAKGGAK